MQPVSIKVRQNQVPPQIPVAPPKDQALEEPKPQKKFTWNKLFYLVLLFLFLSETVFIVYWLNRPDQAYKKYIPKNAIISAYLNVPELAEALLSVQSPATDYLNNLSLKNNLEPKQLPEAFENPALFILMPPSENRLIWLAIGKVNVNKFQEGLKKAEQELKKNYNLISEDYRQHEITEIKALGGEKNKSIFYSLAGSFLIFGNDRAQIQAAIDRMIEY